MDKLLSTQRKLQQINFFSPSKKEMFLDFVLWSCQPCRLAPKIFVSDQLRWQRGTKTTTTVCGCGWPSLLPTVHLFVPSVTWQHHSLPLQLTRSHSLPGGPPRLGPATWRDLFEIWRNLRGLFAHPAGSGFKKFGSIQIRRRKRRRTSAQRPDDFDLWGDLRGPGSRWTGVDTNTLVWGPRECGTPGTVGYGSGLHALSLMGGCTIFCSCSSC